MATSTRKVYPKFSSIVLSEDDVPGAKLPHQVIEANSNVQLKRWLQCRGLKRTGLRGELIQRVKDCQEAGHTIIDVSIDEGTWFQRKVLQQESTSNTQGNVIEAAVIPVNGWGAFPSKEIPKYFNYGNIYQYFIESVCNLSVSSSKEEEVDDFHTEKPLKRGETYFVSGHVKDMMDNISEGYYFVKANVQASYKVKFYQGSIVISANTGYIALATCNCKASAMGRCSHIAAILTAVLDYVTKFGTSACTSKPCEWNRGRLTGKDPKPVHLGSYQGYKRKNDSIISFDPRPKSMRNSPTSTDINNFVYDLDASNTQCMWSTLLTEQYGDYEIDSMEKEILRRKCTIFLENLKVGRENSIYPTEICKVQKSDEWFKLRALRITASEAKRVYSLKASKSVSNYLRQKLWTWQQDPLTTRAMQYGLQHEQDAIEAFKSVNSDIEVISTGLWVHPSTPELACSPDGLIRLSLPASNKYGILEVKCPFILSDIDPNEFDKKLKKKQMSSFCLERVDGMIRLKENHSYYYQVQAQMGITGLHWSEFVVWSPIGMFQQTIDFNAKFWEQLKGKLVCFHHQVLCPEYFEMRTPRNLSALTIA